jgi:hypothetical protein
MSYFSVDSRKLSNGYIVDTAMMLTSKDHCHKLLLPSLSFSSLATTALLRFFIEPFINS